MGRRGSPPAIAASLMALVRPRAGAITVPMHSAARNAHLLATAVLNMSRVETAPLPGAEDLNPLLPLFAVQQVRRLFRDSVQRVVDSLDRGCGDETTCFVLSDVLLTAKPPPE